MTRQTEIGLLSELARRYGIQTSYQDVFSRRCRAKPESLLAVLQCLGAPVTKMADVSEALRRKNRELWNRMAEPVYVSWCGKPAELEVRVSPRASQKVFYCELTLEDGRRRRWKTDAGQLTAVRNVAVGGKPYEVRSLQLSEPLPMGYHRLRLEFAGRSYDSLIVRAPLQAHIASEKCWGVFAPLYALRSRTSWGSGSFSDLLTLAKWIKGLGGGMVATLPILSAYLDRPYDPSPYAPVSRLFWNEFYIDVERVPELETCKPARALLESSDFQAELKAARDSSLVDYRRLMQCKRQVLALLAREFFAQDSKRARSFEDFVAARPAVEDYARFRAVGEKMGRPWQAWPTELRNGTIRATDYDREAMRYHAYVQWIAREQLATLACEFGRLGVQLYLDLPLGVHVAGYDVWRERDVFAGGLDAGSPPDAVFTQGQNWGFAPFHPQQIREQGYAYVISMLRHHFEYAGTLRIDHVMGLHRLFCIPKGCAERDGVYVRYPAEELYAILNLESARHDVAIVGENLGTVPAYVNAALARRKIHGMYVVQYELKPEAPALPRVQRWTVASLNTHDMFPFGAFWQGKDIDQRMEAGLLDAAAGRRERRRREQIRRELTAFLEQEGWLKETETDGRAVLRACLAFLAASPALMSLVNLEDLWFETEPQNIPGTHIEAANWRRKFNYSFEEFSVLPQLGAVLETVNSLRRGKERSIYG